MAVDKEAISLSRVYSYSPLCLPPTFDSPPSKGSEQCSSSYILGISKHDHVSLHLASLHWLPIDYRIKYKLACICYNCMSTNSPPYLSDLLTVYTTARQLRSSSDNAVLRRPSVCTVSIILRSKVFRIIRPFYFYLWFTCEAILASGCQMATRGRKLFPTFKRPMR